MKLVMAVTKANQELKRQRKREKREHIERITNWFMINLSWGILGIVVLRFIENGYKKAETINQMPVLMKVLAGVFAVLAIVLVVCGITKVIKNKKRCFNYAVFSAVIAAVSLWIAFYYKVINFVRGINIPGLAITNSFWIISWGPIAAIVVYLIGALIYTIVRVAIIEKRK